MTKGSGSGAVPLTNGSGSWRPKTYGFGSESATLVQRVANEQEEPGLPSGKLQSGSAGIPAAGKDIQG